jgi:hypothetical protein
VPIPRPRDLVRAKTHPAFAPLLEKLWSGLLREVDMSAASEAAENPERAAA